ncbi:unnamed protein product [Brassica napus]|uniref:(rape) hypothetical protein n=1 Tax=Brassica napus TaxID=3708 RepID=A0A816K2P7_BRANA|nr:unnamed protein product [Brassica napus]
MCTEVFQFDVSSTSETLYLHLQQPMPLYLHLQKPTTKETALAKKSSPLHQWLCQCLLIPEKVVMEISMG